MRNMFLVFTYVSTSSQTNKLRNISCSIFHFAIRAIVQLLFFTPKAGTFPDAPKNQPYLAAVVISNVLCIFLHWISANPAASEAARGYLHGGLFIDFVGQKGPISKLQLLVVDFLVAIFQIVMLGVVVEKEKTKRSLPPENPDDTSPTDPSSEQDHDSEERGMFRSDDDPPLAENDIEMQEIRRSDTRDHIDGRDEPNSLLSESHGPENYKHARDIFTSGEAVIMEMSVLQILRDQWRHTPTPSFRVPSAPTTIRGPASILFRRRFGAGMDSNT